MLGDFPDGITLGQVCSRLSSLQTKYVRMLEALGSAVKGERKATDALDAYKKNHAKILEHTKKSVEQRLSSKFNEELEQKEQRILQLETKMQDIQAEFEKEREATGEQTTRVEQQHATLVGELQEKLDQAQRQLDITERGLQRKIQEEQEKRLVVESRLAEVEGTRLSFEVGQTEMKKELERVRSSLKEAEEEREASNKCLGQCRKLLAQQQKNCTGFQQVVETLRVRLDENRVKTEEIEFRRQELQEYSNAVVAENEQLLIECQRLQALVEQGSLGNGKSRFGEFVEMKVMNKKLVNKMEKLKKRLKDKSEDPRRRDSISSISSALSSNQQQRLLILPPQSSNQTSEFELQRGPVRMPTLMSHPSQQPHR